MLHGDWGEDAVSSVLDLRGRTPGLIHPIFWDALRIKQSKQEVPEATDVTATASLVWAKLPRVMDLFSHQPKGQCAKRSIAPTGETPAAWCRTSGESCG